MDRDTKLIAILRRQYHIILTASWEKIYNISRDILDSVFTILVALFITSSLS